jgi:hypothetical protein
MRRRIHIIGGGGYMFTGRSLKTVGQQRWGEEEDTCNMRRRIHIIWGGGYMFTGRSLKTNSRTAAMRWGGGYM